MTEVVYPLCSLRTSFFFKVQFIFIILTFIILCVRYFTCMSASLDEGIVFPVGRVIDGCESPCEY